MVARKITVVQMLPELESGGVEVGTLELGAYLAGQGHRSIVISGGGRMVPQLEKEGSRHVKWQHIGEKCPRCLKYIFPLRKLMLQEHVDILHLRSRLPAWIGYMAWKTLPKKRRSRLVTTFHGFYSINAYSAIMTWGEKVIAISDVIANHIKTEYKIPDDRVEIIREGINEKLFSPDAVSQTRVEKLKHKWGLDRTVAPVIMLPGRITRLKGHDIFLKALKKIENVKWVAVCVGDWDEKSSYFGELKALTKRLGLDKKVMFTGNCSDMPAALLLSDIVVTASKKPESFGRIAVEAQAMNKPVIATAHGGSLETVRHNKTGWLVKPDDPDSLAEAMETSLTKNNLRELYGSNGREWVCNNFTLNKMCEETLKIYLLLLNGNDVF